MRTLIIMSAFIGSIAMADHHEGHMTPPAGAPAATEAKKITKKEAKALCKSEAKATGKKMTKSEMKECMKGKSM